MSLRSSLGNVLRENGQIYGTDLKKLREYSAGNFEGMYSEPDPEMDMLLGDVQMEAIENEGFMSDELPKFVFGGIVKKAKDFFFAPSTPAPKYQGPFAPSFYKPKGGGVLTRAWNSFKNSSFGSGIANKYNALKTKGGTSTFLGGLLNTVRGIFPKGKLGIGTGADPKDMKAANPMEFKRFKASKQAAAGAQFRKGQVDNMRGKYMTQALSHAISPITNPKAAQLVANFNLTALSSPAFKGTSIGITKRPSSALTAPATQKVNIDAARPMEQIKIT
tara:strand:- start:1621 stop:2448 length:828 start_codon:yes stop_codon:yes gene_type:complete